MIVNDDLGDKSFQVFARPLLEGGSGEALSLKVFANSEGLPLYKVEFAHQRDLFDVLLSTSSTQSCSKGLLRFLPHVGLPVYGKRI